MTCRRAFLGLQQRLQGLFERLKAAVMVGVLSTPARRQRLARLVQTLAPGYTMLSQ